MNVSWTESEITKAAQLWRDHSARDIANILGKSRNSICALAWRNREQFPSKPPSHCTTSPGRPRSAAPKVAQPRKSVLALDFRLPVKVEKVTVERAPRKIEAPPTAPDCAPVAFIDITQSQCKFPLWRDDEHPGPDSPCCGMKIDLGAVYCAFHRNLTFIARAA